MDSTLYCVICLKEQALFWSGHVLKGDKHILAGWCAKCVKPEGFLGHYKKKMEIR